MPDDSLRKNEHNDIRRNLDACRSEHHVWQGVAPAGKIELPDCFVRSALHVEQDDAEQPPDALQRSHRHAPAPKGVSRAVNGEKDPAPVEQNGGLDEREGGRVAAAVDEN